MALKEQLTQEMKAAMKAGDKARLGTIRLALAAIKQKEVDERRDMSDADVLAVIVAVAHADDPETGCPGRLHVAYGIPQHQRLEGRHAEVLRGMEQGHWVRFLPWQAVAADDDAEAIIDPQCLQQGFSELSRLVGHATQVVVPGLEIIKPFYHSRVEP